MTIDNRAQAQQRSDRIAQFRAELDCLQREGVLQLAADQQAQVQSYHQRLLGELASRFDIDHSRQAHQLSLGMRIASLLGALALAASLFFLFYRFWGLFGSTSQVAILIAAPLLGLLLTASLQRLDDSGYFSKLAALLTFTAFVLNLVMLGQIFNITPTDQALLAWAALALLLAYACELRLLLGLGLLSATAFCASRLHSWDGLDWLACVERPENFLLPALLMLASAELAVQRRFAGFAALYRMLGLVCLLLPMLILGYWGEGSYLRLDPDLIEGIYQLLGFAVPALAIYIGIRRQQAELINGGTLLFVIALFCKVFDWWWDYLPKYLFFFLLGLLAILVLLVMRRLRRSLAVEVQP